MAGLRRHSSLRGSTSVASCSHGEHQATFVVPDCSSARRIRFARDLAARAERLREVADAQLLEQPADLAQRLRERAARGTPARGARTRPRAPGSRASCRGRARAPAAAARAGAPRRAGSARRPAAGARRSRRRSRGTRAGRAGAGRRGAPARASGAAPTASRPRSTARAASRIRTAGVDDLRRPLGEVARDVVAQAREAVLVPRRPARLGDQVLQRRDGRVLEHGARARVRRAGERELRRAAEPVLHVTDRRRDVRARAACACPRASPRAAPRASRARARRPRRPRRRAPDSRAPPGRCPAARRPAAARRSSSRAGRGARAARRPRRAPRAAAAGPARAARRGRRRRPPARRARPRRGSASADAAAAARDRTRRAARARRAAARARATSASSSGSLRGCSRSSTAAATSGTGTSDRRSSFGSERISVVTSSSPQRRHEPVEAARLELRQQLERHVHGDAVALGAGVEDVAQRQRQLALPPRLGQRAPVERVAGVADEVRVA